jgi:hypothetical protein
VCDRRWRSRKFADAKHPYFFYVSAKVELRARINTGRVKVGFKFLYEWRERIPRVRRVPPFALCSGSGPADGQTNGFLRTEAALCAWKRSCSGVGSRDIVIWPLRGFPRSGIPTDMRIL